MPAAEVTGTYSDHAGSAQSARTTSARAQLSAGDGQRGTTIRPSSRADATRRLLMGAGIPSGRFRRIEGVADSDPFVKTDPTDPRNRRISITLLYEDPA